MNDDPTPVIVDASVLINLVHADLLLVVPTLPGYDFVVPSEVVTEIRRPEQVAALDAAFGAGVVREESIGNLNTLRVYTELRTVTGRGEAACLAMAWEKLGLVACDERKGVFLRAAEQHVPGRVVNTAGLIVLAIRAGVITIEQADEAKRVLEERRYKMGFDSFGQLIAQWKRTSSAGGEE